MVSVIGWSQSQLYLLLADFLIRIQKKMKLHIEFEIYGTSSVVR